MKFCIGDLPLVTVIVALAAAFCASHGEEERPESELATTFWVITDSYQGGKNTQDSNGKIMVIANGKLHFATAKDGMNTYRLKSLRPDVGERFEMLEDGTLFGSALLVRKQGKATLYINQVNPAKGTVTAPDEATEKCDHAYICRPFPENEGRAHLLKYGAKP